MRANAAEFQKNLAMGQAAESTIAQWLRSRGNTILPVYDIEYETGKGPRLFTPLQQLVAPDMLVFGVTRIFWAECKNKSVFTWYRIRGAWQTGIDLRHYRDYLKVQQRTEIPVWLFFLHESSQPHARDLHAGSPQTCPTGLFAMPIGKPLDHISEKDGMIYWNHSALTLFKEFEA